VPGSPKRWGNNSFSSAALRSELGEMRVRVEDRHSENVRRFETIEEMLRGIQSDVQLLLESRQYARGLWKAASLVAGVVATGVSLVLAYFRAH